MALQLNSLLVIGIWQARPGPDHYWTGSRLAHVKEIEYLTVEHAAEWLTGVLCCSSTPKVLLLVWPNGSSAVYAVEHHKDCTVQSLERIPGTVESDRTSIVNASSETKVSMTKEQSNKLLQLSEDVAQAARSVAFAESNVEKANLQAIQAERNLQLAKQSFATALREMVTTSPSEK